MNKVRYTYLAGWLKNPENPDFVIYVKEIQETLYLVSTYSIIRPGNLIETFSKKSRYPWFSCLYWGYQLSKHIAHLPKKYLLFLFSGCICSPWNRPTSVTCKNVELDVIPQDLPPLINRLNLKGTVYILGQ